MCNIPTQTIKRSSAIALLLLLYSALLSAQESQEIYTFLRLPVSAHAAALGGDNITLTDDDPSLIFHNPALISNTSDCSINLNFMTYMAGSTTASASFVKEWNERTTWGVAGQYMNYGSMRETTADGTEVGDFSAKDIAISASLAYMLSDRWSGGLTLRFISSHIAGFSSTGIGADLGLNYYDDERYWSFSAVAKNLGGEISTYEDRRESMPFDLQVGVSKRLNAAPLRFSATFSRLNRWDVGLLKHLTVGADFLIGDIVYIGAGYNFRRPSEMSINDGDSKSSHGAGLSVGAGLQLQRFKLNIAYGKYHVSASSLIIGATYSL